MYEKKIPKQTHVNRAQKRMQTSCFRTKILDSIGVASDSSLVAEDWLNLHFRVRRTLDIKNNISLLIILKPVDELTEGKIIVE